jgi:4-amino-4-deoxy-L-arabinose transferase-like glycosyltransferase
MMAGRSVWLLIAAFTLVWFSNLEYRKLVRPDEGRYAEIPREMVASGDWVTPRLNDLKYFEKPALQYWGTAAAYSMFGEHHWTARLWSALTGFLGVLLTGMAGARLFGRGAGVIAGAICASSLLYALIGHVNTLDMGVSFFLTAGLFGLMLAQREPAASQAERNWMLSAWCALALAVLSKGLIGAALPFAALVIYSGLARDWSLWRRLHLGKGILLFLAITAPWFIWVSLRNPEFFRFFFIHEHVERFLTKTHSRYQPPWYFIPMLLVGMLPWTLMLGGALARAVRADNTTRAVRTDNAERAVGTDATRPFRPRLFLLVWSVFVFVFFSASSSKLPSYILPILPALALLVADHATRLSARALAWHAAPYAFGGALMMVLAPQVVKFASAEVPVALYQAYVPWLVFAGGVLTAGAVLAVLLAMRDRPEIAMIALAAGGLGCAQLILTGHDSLAPANSSYYLAQQIRPHLKPGLPFYSLGIYEQTLPFYIKRTVTLVEARDELSFGIDQEPQKWVRDYEAFGRRWMSHAEALAIMHPNSLAYFDQHRLPYEIIGRDTRRAVVRKPVAGASSGGISPHSPASGPRQP